MKLTTPKEMQADLSQLEKAIKEFESLFKGEAKGENYYYLVMAGELNKETCQEVTKLYREAGWHYVQCRTSSDNGERGGLTGLILKTK